jgi:hypothetical protein
MLNFLENVVEVKIPRKYSKIDGKILQSVLAEAFLTL